jgi:hypothetical protein
MASILRNWFSFGLGASVGAALVRERASERVAGSTAPSAVRIGTEADFLADEKRFDADEKRLAAESAAKEG